MKTDDLKWGVRSDSPPRMRCGEKIIQKVGEGGVLKGGGPIIEKVPRITILELSKNFRTIE